MALLSRETAGAVPETQQPARGESTPDVGDETALSASTSWICSTSVNRVAPLQGAMAVLYCFGS